MAQRDSKLEHINNKDFLYLTGSLIFEKEDNLNLSNIPESFNYLYHSKQDFRNIIKYLLDIYSKEYSYDLRINFSKTIHPALNQFFITFLENSQEYIFYKHKKLILHLGFPNSKVIEYYSNTILQQSENNWDSSINFFLSYV